MNHAPLIAVDIGNSRIKLARFATAPRPGEIPCPEAQEQLEVGNPLGDAFSVCGATPPQGCSWWIGSVNRPATTQLLDWLHARGAAREARLLCADDLPLVVDLPRPDMVGIDRLLSAVAANRRRADDEPAVVVALGSAITVNFVSNDGHFKGGAILPGIAMSARAMHDYTDLLPLVDMQALADAPVPVAHDTIGAMQSGLFWGAVGGVRELVARGSGGGDPRVFLTGGAAPSVAHLVAPTAEYVPHLVLGGIALVAEASGYWR